MSQNRRGVAISGLGVVSAVGSSVQEFFDSLVAGRSGVRRLPFNLELVGAMAEFSPDAHFTKMQQVALDRFAQLAIVATDQAVRDAGLDAADLGHSRVGVYFGSGIGGAQTIEGSYRSYLDPASQRVSPLSIVLTMPNAAAAHISLKYGIRGPSMTYSVACASAAVAIGEAFRAIRDGYIDIAIAGGSEALLVPGIVAGWNAMRVLAPPDPQHPDRSCRPFALNRSGLVLGEGAGALVLEAAAHAAGRRRPPNTEIVGYGITSDAFHITKPSLDGQVAAMRAALDDAELPAESIGYINAHGTATRVGDIIESQAIERVFGDDARRIPVSSTKPLHGHLLGGAGAVEFIATVMALRSRTLPPTSHLDEPDPECALDYVPNVARHVDAIDAAMSNSFAFGGTNAVLIARAVRDV
ncbi:MAG TPA: beta-ketoacyl-[acyl-carrier-protein] synthase family protein [Casimicrobiaceae bacterium]|nr:beta-ketoacyl-[acyl-carrier-protein] synthase family protein [Casimicrobiaceae bacterium]